MLLVLCNIIVALLILYPKVVKWRESSGTLELEDEDEDEDEKQRQQHVVAVGHGGAVKKQGKQQQQQQSPVAHAYSKACRRVGAAAAVVKAMDQDLYHIPPDMLCHEPRVSRPRPSHFHSSPELIWLLHR